MTDDEQSRHDSEYQEMLALFIALLKASGNESRIDALYELAELRTEHTFQYVLEGLDVDYDYAMNLLKNADDNNITQYDKDLRDRIVAAILNLIDFSVCEEYQMYDEVIDLIGDTEIDFNSEDHKELIAIFGKYNDAYAVIENGDIRYSGAVAAMWIKMSVGDYLVYWTQNDAKVRRSHMELQGYMAHRDEFPSWMIPPIEYNCRCFLEPIEMGHTIGKLDAVKGSIKDASKPSNLSDVYSESLAKCGRIFGPSHNYFSVKESDKEMLSGFVSKLREKYHVQG